MTEFVPNIGLEVHVQLNTMTKALGAELQQFGGDANSRDYEISMALSGTLPKAQSNPCTSCCKNGPSLADQKELKKCFEKILNSPCD
jgi:Asp-tRNA(Asn)/Glu-tRNA(Gln) amidotransferase B subunit